MEETLLEGSAPPSAPSPAPKKDAGLALSPTAAVLKEAIGMLAPQCVAIPLTTQKVATDSEPDLNLNYAKHMLKSSMWNAAS